LNSTLKTDTVFPLIAPQPPLTHQSLITHQSLLTPHAEGRSKNNSSRGAIRGNTVFTYKKNKFKKCKAQIAEKFRNTIPKNLWSKPIPFEKARKVMTNKKNSLGRGPGSRYNTLNEVSKREGRSKPFSKKEKGVSSFWQKRGYLSRWYPLFLAQNFNFRFFPIFPFFF
jgi:hypothetical protein